ncbi:DUF6456 domain-containing protein [Hoeflea sp.]|uniref:DUF6456 domain-containing protein n=1 Tax=Hoeflea sp. TaxID=1940281 RepID=UPI00374A876F
MKSAETRAMRKSLGATIGFLARGAASQDLSEPSPNSHQLVVLVRCDGARREVEPALLNAALSRELIARQTRPDTKICSFVLTTEGRSALKRMMADPDSAFQDQHRRIVTRTDADFGAVSVNDLESPLAALARLKGQDGAPFLGQDLVEAGERLRADFTRGQMTPSLGQRWEPVRAGRMSCKAGGGQDIADAAISARSRVEAAIVAIGPELSGVALDVCCFLKGLSQVERERQWPARSAKLMLRTALQMLARHYAAPRGSTRRVPPLHAP